MVKTPEIRCSVQDFCVTVRTEEYIGRFRDEERFLNRCRECDNYGRLWACPPFAAGTFAETGSYSRMLLTATKITPQADGIPVSEWGAVLRPQMERIGLMLLKAEQKYGGRAFSFAGTCFHCPDGECSRPHGRPCRHPELVRPSLEGYGFDIGATLTELFGMELKWGTGGMLPEYLTLVCAFMHDCGDRPMQELDFIRNETIR